ncbi:MAG: hypothetical protein QCI00_07450, partial [Candidatus Thermoplasmatota archaeon]|nr:hypothetical protein [Candidatus Thermoplasmatota archaeon]
EKQIGSSRPDIIIDKIAIEIKGPTLRRDLDSIANKCLRYNQHFEGPLIVVLFDIIVSDSYYQEWETGIKKTFPNVIIIKKG